MKICIRCQKPRKENEFAKRRYSSGNVKHRGTCKFCQKEIVTRSINKKRGWYLEQLSKARKNRQRLNKQKVVEYLQTHPCVDCGQTNPLLLEFDHRRDKFKNVSVLLSHRNWNSLLHEIEKCEIRCLYCHKIKTLQDRNMLGYIDRKWFEITWKH